MHLLIALSELTAHAGDLIFGPLDAVRRLFDAVRDRADGPLQLLYRVGLLHGTLAEGLRGGGHLLRPAGDVLRTGDDLSHGGVELLEDFVQGGADGGKVAYVLLGDLGRQIAPGDGLEHVGNFADVVAQAADRVVKALGQNPDLVVGVDVDHHGLVLVQPQIALLQGLGQYGQAEQRSGDGASDIRAHDPDPGDNQHSACQEGERNGQDHFLQSGIHGDAGKQQAVDLAVCVVCGGIGAEMCISQNIGLASVALALLEHDVRNVAGEAGAHRPSAVLQDGSVCTHISLENGKLTAHFLFECVQKLRFVLIAGVVCGQLTG